MKKIVVILLANFSASVCTLQSSFINDPMYDNAMGFAESLNIPSVSSSQIWTDPFFVEDSVSSNGLTFAKLDEVCPNSVSFTVISNANIIAIGTIFEYSTFEEVRVALIFKLVCCNMSVEDLVKYVYKLHVTNIGDFCIIETIIDAVTKERIDDFSTFCFVRGAKAVSLRGEDGFNVQPIAEVLDALLKNPPANQ